ncbi:hypothetical protein [Desertihabitans aurantiacus]|uniref:hypothetical protein n=1 Tax=Desertihabitans aurantiacus TaxID=2282477 RepID=UPI000DF8535A|nr:hypothetical protein [Desertihabitans aurantiacus]
MQTRLQLNRRTVLTLTAVGLGGVVGCSSRGTRQLAARCRAVPGVAEVAMTDRVGFASAAQLLLLLADGLPAAGAHTAVAEVCRLCDADGWSGELQVRRVRDSPERLVASTTSPPAAALLADWFTVGDTVEGSVFLSTTGTPGAPVERATCQVRSADVATDLERCVGLATTSFDRWVLEDPEAWQRCTVPAPEPDDVRRWRRLVDSTEPLPAPLRQASWSSSRLPDLRQLELALRLEDDRPPAEVRAEEVLPVVEPMLAAAGLTATEVEATGPITLDLTLLRFEGRREYLGSWRSDERPGPSAPLDADLGELLPLPG